MLPSINFAIMLFPFVIIVCIVVFYILVGLLAELTENHTLVPTVCRAVAKCAIEDVMNVSMIPEGCGQGERSYIHAFPPGLWSTSAIFVRLLVSIHFQLCICL